MKQFFSALSRYAKSFLKMMVNNLHWKLLSLLIAILLWSYVISSNPSITRDLSLSGVDVIISGESVLQGRELALVTDAASALSDVRVRVKVPQSDYAKVSADSVSVELDLSRIRQTGTQVITLTGTTAYGEVVQVIPATVQLEVEELDQRMVPINVYLDNGSNASYWTKVTQKNPTMITISGPSSVVRNVSSALVKVDASSLTEFTVSSEPYVLMGTDGKEVTFPLTRSTSSVMVGVDVYPTKRLLISDDPALCTSGTMPDGYRVVDVEIEPAVITVAGSETLLDGLEGITIEPLDVTDVTQSFTAVASVAGVRGLQYFSSEQVTVTVYVEEVETTARFDNVDVTVRGLSPNQEASQTQITSVKVIGPYNAIMNLQKSDVYVYVDATGLENGDHELAVYAEVDNHPEFRFEFYPETVQIAIEEKEE